jgi:hypothetical protein
VLPFSVIYKSVTDRTLILPDGAGPRKIGGYHVPGA